MVNQYLMTPYIIRPLQPADMHFMTDLAAAEGWNPGLSDNTIFHTADPEGFFMLEYEDTPAGCISAVAYNSSFGFIGLYIVLPSYRGKGFGMALWRHAMAYLGHRNIGLDGVVAQQENYKKSGFRFACNNIRYRYRYMGGFPEIKTICQLDDFPFETVAAYDRHCFPAPRTSFLRAWIQQPGCIALGIGNRQSLSGYIVLRKCREGYKTGPLFAADREQADALFCTAVSRLPVGTDVFLDVPEPNPEALKLAAQYQMERVFETARMYNRGEPVIHTSAVFGVTSFELG